MNKEWLERFDDLVMELMASENEKENFFGSYLQGGKVLYDFDVIETVIVTMIAPAIIYTATLKGIKLPTEADLEESSKQVDAKILKYILKKGKLE